MGIRLPRISYASPVFDQGRWVGAIFAMAASENCDEPERIISSGFFSLLIRFDD
jgi:hypothetical protein